MPDWLDQEAWAAYVEMRRAMGKRAPFTAMAEKRTIHDLEKLEAQGYPNGEVLWQSVTAGYRGVFPLKNKPAAPKQQKSFKERDADALAERVREMTGGIINPRRQGDIFEMEVTDGIKRIGPAH